MESLFRSPEAVRRANIPDGIELGKAIKGTLERWLWFAGVCMDNTLFK